MKKFLLFVAIALLNVIAVYAQSLNCNSSSVNAGNDTTIHSGDCATLTAVANPVIKSTTSYIASSIPYNSYPYTGTPILVAIDDRWSGALNLLFPFCFFGNKYTQCVVGSNGQISFNLGLANQFNDYLVNDPMPFNYDSYNNTICAPFYDIDPSKGGHIYYQAYGTFPCRTFVVSWDSIPVYGANCNQFLASQQIVLYETTNIIEIFIKNKPDCPQSTSTGKATLGIQNNAATQAYTFPGKNNANFTESLTGYRFTPDGPVNPIITYEWLSMQGNVLATGPTLSVCPCEPTDYIVKAKIVGSCDTIIVADTVRVNIDRRPEANFTSAADYGCSEDTIHFTNTSQYAINYNWDFGDGNGSTLENPTHIYKMQGSYNVTLIVSNALGCKDTLTKPVDINHSVEASFTTDRDSLCQYNSVQFTSTSTGNNLTYEWDFGDGSATDNSVAPSHFYSMVGTYTVRLIVGDDIPCYDTAYKTIVVDTVTNASFVVTDTVLCEGQSLTLAADYSKLGNTGIVWDFGNGNLISNRDTVTYAYDSSGTYTVKLTASYRICPDTTFKKDITINPFPRVDLGPDTVLCPNGEPIVLFDHIGTPGGTYLWNTGATGSSIVISSIGTYSTTVTANGCATTDSIEVMKDCYIDIPNGFTPNGDGSNDYFLPRQLLSRSVTTFKMSIYNRWGQLIFETTSINGRGWDGKLNGKDQPSGVYVYIIEAGFVNGTMEKYQGNVTLLR